MMKKFTKKTIQFGLMLCLSLGTAFAADIHVKASATGSGDGSSEANAYTTLSAAIGAAASEDKILVYGTLAPTAGIAINPAGNFILTIEGVGTDAIIDCTSKSDGALFDVYKLLILDNLTIKKSTGTTHGGVARIRNSGAVVAKNCVFENNTSSNGGAFNANQSNGGVAVAYSANTGGYTLLIDKCLFRGNNTSGRGGAIRMNSYGVLKVTNSTFVENFATVNGGAISLNASYVAGTVNSDVLTNVTIFDNYVTATAGDRAGGLDTQAATTTNAATANGLLIQNSIIYGNHIGGDGVTPADITTLKATILTIEYTTTTTVTNSLIGVSFLQADNTLTNNSSNVAADLSVSSLTFDDATGVVKFVSVDSTLNSPIDFGDAALLGTTEDQLGTAGNARPGSGAIDAGAWESTLTLSLKSFKFSDDIGGFDKTSNGYNIRVKSLAEAQLFNVSGAKVDQFLIANQHEILNSSFSAGVYVLKLTINGESYAKKFVIE